MGEFTLAMSARLFVFLISVSALLGGCASHSVSDHKAVVSVEEQETVLPLLEDEFDLEAEFEAVESKTSLDPLSGYNRVMTQVNDKFYFWLFKPVAQGYQIVIPEPVRLGVDRFFRNLLMPARFVNNLMQLKPKQAGIELSRFFLNSTFGLLGFTDPAADSFNLRAYPEDFGQTLGYYGIGPGFHIVLPLLGPSNLRDTIGLVPDYYLSPISYIDNVSAEVALDAYRQINYTSLHIGEYEGLKKDAVDLYTFLRDSYEQRRIRLIEE